MATLKDICYQNIAETMVNSPPGLQEIIMGETLNIVEERVEERVSKKLKKKWIIIYHFYQY